MLVTMTPKVLIEKVTPVAGLEWLWWDVFVDAGPGTRDY
jgi:hypothetical protein